MDTYTVVGLTDEAGDLLVAGVLPGRHDCVDAESQSGEFYRYATTVEADDPDEAELKAYVQYRRDCGED